MQVHSSNFLASFGGILTLTVLAIGVPLFVRMPPWCDLTLYDVAARTIIDGGTLFDDVFDTNLPGFVWCLIGIRRVFGNSVEAVRIVDLCIVAAITGLLMRYARKCGEDAASLAWLAACAALFYPFTSEFSHCQRDIWMTLPMMLAISVRSPFAKGLLWGIAVWFKPHVILIALAIWLVTRKHGGRRDFISNLAGGGLVGLLGIAALLITGTWKPFAIVMTKWNANYLLTVWAETGSMFERFLTMFPPWSLLHLVAIPLAIRSTWKLIRKKEFKELIVRRGTLSTFYLAMLAQSCLLQRNFDYVHIPEVLLAFAVITVHVPRALFVVCMILAVSTLLNVYAGWDWCPKHLLADGERLRLWSDCFREDLSSVEYRKRQQSLGLSPEYFSSINVVELGEVADFLRTQNVQDGELIAWHDTPHALYLELGLKPRFRFMHITTTLISEANFERMAIELKKKSLPSAKYIVTDIMHPLRFGDSALWARRSEAGPDMLPPCFTWRLRHSFPFDQPAIFRSGGGHGRYIVHRIENRNPKQFEFQWDLWNE